MASEIPAEAPRMESAEPATRNESQPTPTAVSTPSSSENGASTPGRVAALARTFSALSGGTSPPSLTPGRSPAKLMTGHSPIRRTNLFEPTTTPTRISETERPVESPGKNKASPTSVFTPGENATSPTSDRSSATSPSGLSLRERLVLAKGRRQHLRNLLQKAESLDHGRQTSDQISHQKQVEVHTEDESPSTLVDAPRVLTPVATDLPGHPSGPDTARTALSPDPTPRVSNERKQVDDKEVNIPSPIAPTSPATPHVPPTDEPRNLATPEVPKTEPVDTTSPSNKSGKSAASRGSPQNASWTPMAVESMSSALSSLGVFASSYLSQNQVGDVVEEEKKDELDDIPVDDDLDMKELVALIRPEDKGAVDGQSKPAEARQTRSQRASQALKDLERARRKQTKPADEAEKIHTTKIDEESTQKTLRDEATDAPKKEVKSTVRKKNDRAKEGRKGVRAGKSAGPRRVKSQRGSSPSKENMFTVIESFIQGHCGIVEDAVQTQCGPMGEEGTTASAESYDYYSTDGGSTDAGSVPDSIEESEMAIMARRSRLSKGSVVDPNASRPRSRLALDLGERNSDIMSLPVVENERASDINNLDIHDKNFIRAFISGSTQFGVPMLIHKRQRDQSFSRPTSTKMFLCKGIVAALKHFEAPSLRWATGKNESVRTVSLFDIQAIERAESLQLENYPLAMPQRSMLLTLRSGEVIVFEARNEDEAMCFTYGMRWVIARLSFNLIIGNLKVSCELIELAPGLERSEDAGWALPEELQQIRAMNDVSNTMVDKQIGCMGMV